MKSRIAIFALASFASLVSTCAVAGFVIDPEVPANANANANAEVEKEFVVKTSTINLTKQEAREINDYLHSTGDHDAIQYVWPGERQASNVHDKYRWDAQQTGTQCAVYNHNVFVCDADKNGTVIPNIYTGKPDGYVTKGKKYVVYEGLYQATPVCIKQVGSTDMCMSSRDMAKFYKEPGSDVVYEEFAVLTNTMNVYQRITVKK